MSMKERGKKLEHKVASKTRSAGRSMKRGAVLAGRDVSKGVRSAGRGVRNAGRRVSKDAERGAARIRARVRRARHSKSSSA
jgi:hypothetical protein